MVFIIIRTQGYVEGTEFAPTHFQQRSFNFYELPLIHLQITPIKRRANTPKTAVHVRMTGLVKTAGGTPSTWHLVQINRGITGSTPANADLLIEQLDLEHDGGHYWEKWSKDHVPLAKVLWPVIQKLAERELYILIPAAFEMAQLEQTPQELQQNLDDYLKQQYLTLIQDMQAAKRTVLAEQFLEEAKADFPNDARFEDLLVGSPSQ